MFWPGVYRSFQSVIDQITYHSVTLHPDSCQKSRFKLTNFAPILLPNYCVAVMYNRAGNISPALTVITHLTAPDTYRYTGVNLLTSNLSFHEGGIKYKVFEWNTNVLMAWAWESTQTIEKEKERERARERKTALLEKYYRPKSSWYYIAMLNHGIT